MSVSPVTQTRPSGPNGWLVIGGVVTALLILGGVVSAASWFNFRTETSHAVYTGDLTSISVDMDTGDVSLTPGEPGVVDVERRTFWSFEKPVVEEKWDGQNLRVTVYCQGVAWIGRGCGVNYRLAIPTDIAVDVHTSTGDVTATNIDGELHLTSSTGDIHVTGGSGGLQLRTSTGDVSATDVESESVDASASTGDVRLEFTSAPRTVSAHTSTGDVRVVVPDGEAYHVEADTSTGDTDVSVRRDDDSDRSIIAKTSTGDVDVVYA
jgi:Toastrack DUF4097